MKVRVVWLLILLCPLVWQPANARNDGFYTEHSHRQQAVAHGLQAARSSDKLLLLIIGANWCEDSRSLADFLRTDDVKATLSEHYEMVVIDAQWLDNLKPLLSQFNYPAYFGTPSLLIIDPKNKTLVNRDSVQRWQSAHSESAGSLNHYLALMADAKNWYKHDQLSAQLVAQIRQFEADQADIIYHAYARLGPLLEKEEQGESVPELDGLWEAVRRYRYQLQHDLTRLHGLRDVDKVELPTYPTLAE